MLIITRLINQPTMGETLITPHGEMITEEKQYLEVDNIPGCYVAVM